jgi:hypothetical protein
MEGCGRERWSRGGPKWSRGGVVDLCSQIRIILTRMRAQTRIEVKSQIQIFKEVKRNPDHIKLMRIRILE